MQVRVQQVTAAETHSLRRQVLRGGDPDSVVEFPGDDAEGALHLAAFDPAGGDTAGDTAGDMVGIATFFPSPYEGSPAYQLRGMAVVEEWQGRGIGSQLLAAGVERLRSIGVGLVWANGRDSALGFYERHGWKVVGEQFEYGPVRLPHHVVVLDLAASG